MGSVTSNPAWIFSTTYGLFEGGTAISAVHTNGASHLPEEAKLREATFSPSLTTPGVRRQIFDNTPQTVALRDTSCKTGEAIGVDWLGSITFEFSMEKEMELGKTTGRLVKQEGASSSF